LKGLRDDPLESIPKMHILMKRTISVSDGTQHFEWSITMKMLDATGKRDLGYRASGRITANNEKLKVLFEREPQVHDEDRPVWTTMNLTDRPDVRKKFESLVGNAMAKLKASGDSEFEYEKK
jgi:hypothetical protein